jgi:hypothetical protein
MITSFAKLLSLTLYLQKNDETHGAWLACELSSRYISPVERHEGNGRDAHPATEGQGQAVKLRVLESWNKQENGQGQAVKLRALESWKGRYKGQGQAVKNFVSWNPGIEGEKESGSGCRTSCLGILE